MTVKIVLNNIKSYKSYKKIMMPTIPSHPWPASGEVFKCQLANPFVSYQKLISRSFFISADFPGLRCSSVLWTWRSTVLTSQRHLKLSCLKPEHFPFWLLTRKNRKDMRTSLQAYAIKLSRAKIYKIQLKD